MQGIMNGMTQSATRAPIDAKPMKKAKRFTGRLCIHEEQQNNSRYPKTKLQLFPYKPY